MLGVADCSAQWARLACSPRTPPSLHVHQTVYDVIEMNDDCRYLRSASSSKRASRPAASPEHVCMPIIRHQRRAIPSRVWVVVVVLLPCRSWRAALTPTGHTDLLTVLLAGVPTQRCGARKPGLATQSVALPLPLYRPPRPCIHMVAHARGGPVRRQRRLLRRPPPPALLLRLLLSRQSLSLTRHHRHLRRMTMSGLHGVGGPPYWARAACTPGPPACF
jgi:hypothetical protein